MKKLFLVMILAFFITQGVAAEPLMLNTTKDKLSYSMGVSLVRDFKRMGQDVDFDALIQGIRAESSGSKLLLDEAVLHRLVNTFKIEQQMKRGDPKKLAPP